MLKRLAQHIRIAYLRHRIESARQDMQQIESELRLAPQLLALTHAQIANWLNELRQIDERHYRSAMRLPPWSCPPAPPQGHASDNTMASATSSRRLDINGDPT